MKVTSMRKTWRCGKSRDYQGGKLSKSGVGWSVGGRQDRGLWEGVGGWYREDRMRKMRTERRTEKRTKRTRSTISKGVEGCRWKVSKEERWMIGTTQENSPLLIYLGIDQRPHSCVM